MEASRCVTAPSQYGVKHRRLLKLDFVALTSSEPVPLPTLRKPPNS